MARQETIKKEDIMNKYCYKCGGKIDKEAEIVLSVVLDNHQLLRINPVVIRKTD